MPVIEGLVRRTDRLISIDTLKPDVARAAIQAGARLWNDVTALKDPASIPLAAQTGCDVVLMHMQGAPQAMQDDPRYLDVVAEVEAFLLDRARAAEAGGVDRSRIWLDPGIGFGKTAAHNLALLAAAPRLVAHGYPVLLAASRKRFIASLVENNPPAGERLGGSIATALHGARSGCRMVRVHDVAQTVQALAVWSAIEGKPAA
jgi:dihydropteroate synthase